ncbi:MAG: allene oxide cyclase family protein [Actinomycetota bacterium]
MKRTMSIVATAAAALLIAGLVAQAGADTRRTVTMTVIEHANTDKVIDVGKPGDSTGDLLTFHNKVYDDADAVQVGTDLGDCVRINPKRGSWECRWTTNLEGGSITVEGPFYDTKDTTMAITGGTGVYVTARGSMDLHALDGGERYEFTFNIEP